MQFIEFYANHMGPAVVFIALLWLVVVTGVAWSDKIGRDEELSREDSCGPLDQFYDDFQPKKELAKEACPVCDSEKCSDGKCLTY